MPPHRFLLIVGMIILAQAQSAFALDLEVNASAGTQFTSNVGQTAEQQTHDWILTPGLMTRAVHRDPNLTVDADYRFIQRRFQRGSFDNETVTTGTGRIRAHLVPERLDFTIINSRTESAIRALEPASPNNRQQTTNTQAGPTLKFRARGKDEVHVEYLYGTRNSARTDSNAESHTATFHYTMAQKTTNTFRFEAQRQHVDYENATVPNLRANLTQVEWLRDINSLDWSIAVGLKNTQRGLGRKDADAVVAGIVLDWSLSQDSAINFRASRDLRDQATILSLGSADFGERLITDSDLNELFESRDLFLGLSQKLGSSNVSIGFLHSEQDFVDSAINRSTKSDGLLLTGIHRINRSTELSARLQSSTQSFVAEDVDLKRTSGSVLLTRKINRQLSLSTGIFYDRSDSASRLIDNIEFDEWQVLFRVNYAFNF